MKRFRRLLASLLAVAFCSIILVAPIANAATKISLVKTTIKSKTTMTWYPTSDPDGRNLTNGGTQSMYFSFSESGNKINIGFRRTSNLAKYSWYSGTLGSSTKSKYASKKLTGPSGYYRPYLTNNNDTVSITVKDTSYYTFK